MPDEELNNANPEENKQPPDDAADENTAEKQSADSDSADPNADDIKEPSM